jgi:hypothetical protein
LCGGIGHGRPGLDGRHHLHILRSRLLLSNLDGGVCGVRARLKDRCAGGQGRHDMHCMRGREVLCSIDASMRGLCSRTVRGIDGLKCIGRLHWMLGGAVRGRDGVGVGVGVRGVRWWLGDRHAGVGGRHAVYGLHKRALLGSLHGGMRGLCGRDILGDAGCGM